MQIQVCAYVENCFNVVQLHEDSEQRGAAETRAINAEESEHRVGTFDALKRAFMNCRLSNACKRSKATIVFALPRSTDRFRAYNRSATRFSRRDKR